ncbi:MAG: hypothetical protein COW30_06655 [Rhodospirillales bacterium CG15_BIG_FIL_POST_REV_8_21_14_020_66_15]|nr:MAG: hypothetical protein COW30_06655 [Rhodospirillales bacterium CG15_BIG_FIL_POST_REV_8_21_14_020_66_15]
MSNGEEKMDPKKEISLADALEHARSLFVYSAGQRLTTIRYFFVAYSILAVAYTRIITETRFDEQQIYLSATCALATFITLVFFGLDIRNANMVHVEEHAMSEIENIIVEATILTDKFKITYNWSKTNRCALREILQYKIIMPINFAVFFIISALLMIYHYKQICEIFIHDGIVMEIILWVIGAIVSFLIITCFATCKSGSGR